MFRYIRKKDESFVLSWSPALAARDDMVECDAQGGIVKGGNGALPLALLNLPVPAVPIAPVETPVPQVETPVLRVETPVPQVAVESMDRAQMRDLIKTKGYDIDQRLGTEKMRKKLLEVEREF